MASERWRNLVNAYHNDITIERPSSPYVYNINNGGSSVEEMPPVHTNDHDNGDFTITTTGDNAEIVNELFSTNPCAEVDFKILSPDEAALQNVLVRIKEFHQWIKEERNDLEEECESDLSALVDKLEETFPELSGESDEDEPPPIHRIPSRFIDFDGDIQYFRDSIMRNLGVSQEDRSHLELGEPGFSSNYQRFNNED